MKCFGNNSDGYIISKDHSAGSGFEIRVRNNTIYAELNPGGSAITLTAPIEADDEFHTIVVTFKNQEHFRLYLDGELRDDFGLDATIGTQTSFSIPSLINDENLVIGEFSSIDGRVFNGLINQISLSSLSHILTDAETMFGNTNYNLSNNLVASWNFNQGEGDILTDLSGNGNDGTIVGATWSTDVPADYGGDNSSNNNNQNYSTNFDGVDEYVDFGDIFNVQLPITIQTYLKFLRMVNQVMLAYLHLIQILMLLKIITTDIM